MDKSQIEQLTKYLMYAIIAIIVIYLIYYLIKKFVYGGSGNLTTVADATKQQTISTKNLSSGKSSTNFSWGIWVYIQQWSMNNTKPVLQTGSVKMDLAASTNDLTVTVNTDGSNQEAFTLIEGMGSGGLTTTQNIPGLAGGAGGAGSAGGAGGAGGMGGAGGAGGFSGGQKCGVKNIPIQKWVHIMAVVYGKSVDVYIDGKLVKTCLLKNLVTTKPGQDAIVTPGGGFNGLTSRLRFLPYPANPQEAYNIYKEGPGGGSSGGGGGGFSGFNLANLFPTLRLQLELEKNGKDMGAITI